MCLKSDTAGKQMAYSQIRWERWRQMIQPLFSNADIKCVPEEHLDSGSTRSWSSSLEQISSIITNAHTFFLLSRQQQTKLQKDHFLLAEEKKKLG